MPSGQCRPPKAADEARWTEAHLPHPSEQHPVGAAHRAARRIFFPLCQTGRRWRRPLQNDSSAAFLHSHNIVSRRGGTPGRTLHISPFTTKRDVNNIPAQRKRAHHAPLCLFSAFSNILYALRIVVYNPYTVFPRLISNAPNPRACPSRCIRSIRIRW